MPFLKEIWCEGDLEFNTAAHLGYGKGKTLKEACDDYASKNKYFARYYNPDTMMFKDCRLFETYEGARESHG